MIRPSTIRKEKAVVKKFHELLRCGKDYTVDYLYLESAKKCYIAKKTAGNIVRKYYKRTITAEMKEFIYVTTDISHEETVNAFSREFNLCNRESRLIVRYINRNKT